MLRTRNSRFLTRLRTAAGDDRGAANAFMIVAAVVVFGVVSVAFGGGLQTAMKTMQQQKVNTALAGQVAAAAMKEAGRGYPVVSALPAETDITLTIGNTEVPAVRHVEVNVAEQTANVTVVAGRYASGSYHDPHDCTEGSASCVSATETAIPSLSQTFPDTEGVTLIDQTGNVPATTEVAWKDVAAGADTVVAIDSDGTLWSWGKNTFSEAGTGNVTPVLTPAKIAAVTGTKFTQVAAGVLSMYAVDVDGGLWTWGRDNVGQLGNTSAVGGTKVPTKLAGATWKTVDAGDNHACGIRTDGSLWCWGSGDGKWRGSTSYAAAPVRVHVAGESDATTAPTTFTALSVGATHQVAISAAGDVYTWGAGTGGQLGLGNTSTKTQPTRVTFAGTTATFVDVAASVGTTYAVDAYGRLYAWGASGHGQLGDGETVGATSPVRVASNILFRSVYAAGATAYGVARDGTLYTWGAAADGALGTGDDTGQHTPTAVSDDAAFLTVAATAPSSTIRAAVDSTHRLWVWGAGDTGSFGDGSSTPQTRDEAQQQRIRAGGGITVTQIAAGTNHTVTLGTDGTVWAFGLNSSGQLGNGTKQNASTSVHAKATYTDKPAQVTVGQNFTIVTGQLGRAVGAGHSNVGQLTGTSSRPVPGPVTTDQFASVVAGHSHTVAIDRATGGVVAWGKNTYGQVGNGSTSNATAPVDVKGLPADAKFVQVAAGQSFSAALDIDGNVYTWGRNVDGQLGDGSTVDRHTATKTLLPAPVVRIAAGDHHMLALDADGQLWAWGKNTSGQLGIGSRGAARAIPVEVPTSLRFVAIDGAGDHSVAVTSNGKLAGWGGASQYDSGHGNTTTNAPAIIDSSKDRTFSTVAADGKHSFALDSTGNLFGWGTNTGGSLGRATVAAPTSITGMGPVVSVDTSATHSAAVAADGKVYLTGANTNGQLGNGSTTGAGSFTSMTGWPTTVQAQTAAYAKRDGTWQQPTFVQVDAGGHTTAAIDEHGHLWAWGSGSAGQLGAGTNQGATAPQLVTASTRFAAVSVGAQTTAALSVDGTVWVFGAGTNAANGRAFNTSLPQRVGITGPVKAVDTGTAHTVAVAADGDTVYAWGRNDQGQLGVAAGANQVFPVKVARTDIAEATAGNGYTLLLNKSRQVTVTGAAPWSGANQFTGRYADLNAAGNLVAGATTAGVNHAHTFGVVTGSTPATARATVTSSTFTDAAAGGAHIVLLDANGTVWTWGANSNGQLGRSGAAATPTIVPVIGDPDRKVFTPEAAPVVATTTWPVATIDAGATGRVQVNVDAGMPLRSVVVVCADGTRKHAAEALASSGDFSFANISVEDLAGCGTPTLAAVLDGAPASASEVKVVIVPLVYTSDLTSEW